MRSAGTGTTIGAIPTDVGRGRALATQLLSVVGFVVSVLTWCGYSTYAQASTITADNLATSFGGGRGIGFTATSAGFLNSAAGQTFTASVGGFLETVTVRHSTTAPELNPLVMDFFAATAGSPANITGASLGQVSIPYSQIPGGGSYVTEFDFSAFAIELIAGNSYGFLLHTASGRTGDWQYGVGYNSANSYTGGNLIAGTNGVTGSTGAISNHDLAFRVTVAVPEPATVAILVSALAGLGFARTRRFSLKS